MSVFDDLIGKTVTALYVSQDKETLRFVVEGEDLIYQAEGDCCSESWFNHLYGLDALIGHEVKSVVEKPMLEIPGTRQDEDEVFGWTFTTNHGYVDLEMRNSSNGYYGGWVSKVYSGVSDMVEVRSDF